ncbi:MAG: CoA-transferase [Chloroflexota bacterium]
MERRRPKPWRTQDFQLPEHEGRSKVNALDRAIRQTVKPGMVLYIGSGANAALRALLRQFHGTKPEFTLVMPALSLSAIHLLHAGLVKRIVTAYYGAGYYPTTGPSPVIQELNRKGKVELESWSLLSLTQRLMAGALGLPFLPTRSLQGSSMAEENQRSFSLIEDPFGSGIEVGAVKALNPDIALVHGWAADHYGFTITAPAIESGDCLWGTKASKGGAVVSVEKVVSTDFIRRHAPLVTIPGHMVAAVCEASMGAHPEAMVRVGVEGLRAYEHDFEFLRDCRNASLNPRSLDAWLREWVLDCPHENYIRKLGAERISALQRQAQGSVALAQIPRQEGWNDTEMMLVAAAREVERLVMERGYALIISGLGLPSLVSWLAYYQLRNKGIDIDLMTGTGFVGFAPRPGDTLPLSMSNLATSKMVTDIVDCQGVFVGGRNSRCLTVLNAAQVDRFGNLNSSLTAEGALLVGSGGANDAANAPDVLVVIPQSAERFVERLPYITTPGVRVQTLVSDMGIFEKHGSGAEFMLVRYFTGHGQADATAALARIRKNCGWQPRAAPALALVPPPTPRELMLLRNLDPQGHVRGA